MDITTKHLELWVNDQNKGLYQTMYDLILNQFEDALRHTDIANLTPEREKVLGTCGIYLSSLVELLHSLRDLMDKGYIESAGAIATSCWERALTLRKILIEPQKNAQIHTDHQLAKKTPWTVFQMVRHVLANERRIKNISAKRPYEEENFYLQFTLLSSIKHGNPYTISHLYRPDYSSDEKLFKLKPNDSLLDKDLKIYIKLLAADNALDALIDYSREFRTDYGILENIREEFNTLIATVELQVPPILLTTPQEMGQDFWDHLLEQEKNLRF